MVLMCDAWEGMARLTHSFHLTNKKQNNICLNIVVYANIHSQVHLNTYDLGSIYILTYRMSSFLSALRMELPFFSLTDAWGGGISRCSFPSICSNSASNLAVKGIDYRGFVRRKRYQP